MDLWHGCTRKHHSFGKSNFRSNRRNPASHHRTSCRGQKWRMVSVLQAENEAGYKTTPFFIFIPLRKPKWTPRHRISSNVLENMQTTIIESVLKKDDTVWRAPCRNYVAFVKEGKRLQRPRWFSTFFIQDDWGCSIHIPNATLLTLGRVSQQQILILTNRLGIIRRGRILSYLYL